MLLKTPGETCLIDFNDVVSWISHELRKVDIDFDRRDRNTISDIVYTIMDDWLTQHMRWTKRYAPVATEHYLKQFPVSIDRHPEPYELVEQIYERIDKMFKEIYTFPTWHVMEVHRKHSTFQITLGQDYRIMEFMKEHGHEYEVSRYDW